MSNFYVRRRADANHKEIVDALQRQGIAVADLAGNGDGISDIVTCYFDVCFIELKFGKTAKLKKSQVWFLATWPGYCGIAKSMDEAAALARFPRKHALTKEQKHKMLQYHATMKGKEVHLATIEKLIAPEEVEIQEI